MRLDLTTSTRFRACILAALFLATPAFSQAILSGRLTGPRFPGSPDPFPYSAVLCIASRDGAGTETRAFRTWETAPAGWYRLDGGNGNTTLVFTGPAHFIRPLVRNNLFTRPGEFVDHLSWTPQFDLFCFHERDWDPNRATDYFQTFVARGKSVTQVGFRLAHDGMDGGGPQKQNLRVSIHRRAPGSPDTWPQVGPTATVLGVDSGGAKNYVWSAGWNSGEVPLQPGETYAVHLRAATPGNTFQAFWRPDADTTADCYRLGPGRAGWQQHDLWLAVGTDGDGLLIPYNKRVHQQFGDFAGFASKWTQTYVAQGRSLAAVVLYAATGGTQPPLSRQRAVVRVRRHGINGPLTGIAKIAVGNGNYTGDASWGVFCVAYAPEEVPLVPGETYAIEFASLENYASLHGFVNSKGQMSDERPGFNPYRKFAPDDYAAGTAYRSGRAAMAFDLDLQIIEYEARAPNWSQATDPTNLLRNGDFETAGPSEAKEMIPAWRQFALDPGATHAQACVAEGPGNTNHLARVVGGGVNQQPVDGGFGQRVGGLDPRETYRLTGQVRASWAVDSQHQCLVGYDPTGQDTNPHAATIAWETLPGLHSQWVPFTSQPIRPTTNAISVWLRGRTTLTTGLPFQADFDAFALKRVRTEPPNQTW